MPKKSYADKIAKCGPCGPDVIVKVSRQGAGPNTCGALVDGRQCLESSTNEVHRFCITPLECFGGDHKRGCPLWSAESELSFHPTEKGSR